MITDGLDLIDPEYYEAHGAPHDTWTRLRAEAPLHYVEPTGFESFWAVTRHADICEISKQPDLFLSDPGIVIMSDDQKEFRGRGEGLGAVRILIETDPPEHRGLRKITSPWFTPNAMKRLNAEIEASAKDLVDRLAGDGGEGECDFAMDVAVAHPLRILSKLLGIPRERESDILRLTNQLFASEDPELQRPGEDRGEAVKALGLELFQLFQEVVDDRRANPQDDVASVIAHGQLDGAPLDPMTTFGYYLIVFTAGHDTTKNSIAGGMQALIENPDQLEKLKQNPDMINDAVEEIVRWTTPVNYMKRTVARDLEFGETKLREGDQLGLFYASANRDATIFDDPFAFRIDRKPNRHLGFGIGEHFCLGANLARVSQRALFRELTSRLESIELTGDPVRIRSSFVVGVKHLPVRYRLKAA